MLRLPPLQGAFRELGCVASGLQLLSALPWSGSDARVAEAERTLRYAATVSLRSQTLKILEDSRGVVSQPYERLCIIVIETTSAVYRNW